MSRAPGFQIQIHSNSELSTPINGLRVSFPDEIINYGDVPAGATTGYVDVPAGVYQYSAFRFQYNGAEVRQLVDDFVGEVPMKGHRFTYTLEFVDLPDDPIIAIRSVSKDR